MDFRYVFSTSFIPGKLTEVVPQVINALPQDTQSLVTNEIYAFVYANLTDVNKTRFLDVAQTAITINATPALWFSCAGGSILLILAVVTLVDKWGNSKYPLGMCQAMY